MRATVDRFREELVGINAGRVRPALIEPIRVDAYGELVPISHIATVVGGTKARSLLVTPFDQSLVGPTTKAIQKSGLGLNPQAAGTSILVVIPAPDDEQRAKLAARARALAEQQRVSIRNIRKDARNHAKRAGTLKQIESKIEALTARMVVDVDALLQAKADEINWLDPRWNKT
jgi:ribosome recycling factor